MKEKKEHGIIYILITSILIAVLCFIAGVFIDGNIFTGTDGVKGHGMPIFTLVLPATALIVMIIRIIIYVIRKITRGR